MQGFWRNTECSYWLNSFLAHPERQTTSPSLAIAKFGQSSLLMDLERIPPSLSSCVQGTKMNGSFIALLVTPLCSGFPFFPFLNPIPSSLWWINITMNSQLSHLADCSLFNQMWLQKAAPQRREDTLGSIMTEGFLCVTLLPLNRLHFCAIKGHLTIHEYRLTVFYIQTHWHRANWTGPLLSEYSVKCLVRVS